MRRRAWANVIWLCAVGLCACKDDPQPAQAPDGGSTAHAGHSGSAAGTAAGSGGAGQGGSGAGQDAGMDADTVMPDAAPPDGQVDPMLDSGSDANTDPDLDGGVDVDAGDDAGVVDLTPQRPDCTQVPTGTRCLGGDNAVLLLVHQRGRVAALDPDDGTYLGHIAEDATPLNLNAVQATQGPDNCIYVLKDGNASDFAIRRLDTDGTLIDDIIPFVDNNGDGVVADPPSALAFHDGTLYIGSPVSSSDLSAPPSVGTFDLTGAQVAERVDDGTRVTGMLVMGDGSLLVSEDEDQELRWYPASGGPSDPVASLVRPRQLAFSADERVVVAQNSLGDPIVELDLATGSATRVIRPVTPGTTTACQTRGVALLGNGRWIMTGGGCSDSFGVGSVDPEGALGDMNRQGMQQHLPDSIYDDEVPNDGLSSLPNGYQAFGFACLPDGVIDAVP